MTAVLVGQAEPHSPEWHALRREGIGGSEIAAVVGLSRWTSAYQLWHRKRGNIGEQPQNEAMEWGTRLEPAIVQKFIDEHPEWDVQATPGTYCHEDRAWQRCNPDGLLIGEETALLEVKTVNAFADDFTKTDIPIYYRTQIQWQLDIFGLDRCYAAVLVGGNTYYEYIVEANAEDQATLRAAAERFWNSIQTDDEPPLDATDHTYRTVVELNPDLRKDEFIDLDPRVWADYVQAKVAINHAEGELTLAKSQILHAMRGVQFARFAGEKVLRRQRHASGSYYLKEVS